jgi:uncharacterized protein YggE
MRILLVLIFLAAGQVAAVPAAADQGDPPRVIKASASAEASAQPDRVRVVIVVESHGLKADRAMRTNAMRSATVLSRLKSQIIEPGTVTTGAFHLIPEYGFSEKDGKSTKVVTGYLVSNTVDAITADLDSVGPIIDAAVPAGATRISSVNFFLADERDLKRQALSEAGKRARSEAKTVAKSLGVELGKLLEASVGPTTAVFPRPALRGMGRAAAGTTILPAAVKVRATVNVIYEVE